jgi:SnoaL-like domain
VSAKTSILDIVSVINLTEKRVLLMSSAVTTHISELIQQVLLYQDQGQWEKLALLFVENPYIDDQALTDQLPSERSSSAAIYNWRRIVRDLYYSAKHKAVGVMKIERTGKKEVEAESEVEARYYTAKGNTRYVMKMRGVYKYTFKKVAGRWKIADMRLSVLSRSLEPIGA